MNAYSLSELPSSQWSRQLAAMRADGVQYVRSDADWGTIEPNAPGGNGPVFRFSSSDRWVRALALHRLRWQPILDYNNSWAVAVKRPRAFAAFGRALAARYGAGGSFWRSHRSLPYVPVRILEVWNEENAKPWYLDPVSYGPLYEATRAAIHAVDPSASVDVGGLADDSEDFSTSSDYPSKYVVRMLLTDPGLAGHIDAFALHPYGTAAGDAIAWVGSFRRTLDQLHDGSVPIDITEVGWVTGDPAQETWRAMQMSALGTALSHSTSGVREVAPYDWINPTVLHDAGDFGFVGAGGTSTKLRPAGAAWFAAFLAPASSATKTASCRNPAGQVRGARRRSGKGVCAGAIGGWTA